MSQNPATQDLIAVAVALPVEERLALIDALHVSLAGACANHGPTEAAAEVSEAWRDEIARRMAEVQSGEVVTLPAEDAEEMIRSNGNPSV